MKRMITHPLGLRFKNFAVVILVSLLTFSWTNAYSTSFSVRTEAELDAAISNSVANDYIFLKNDIVVTSEKILSKTVNIDGCGYTISVPNPGLDAMGRLNPGASTFRVFTISSAIKVYLANLIIKGGVVDQGGALLINGTLYLSNSTISNSRGLSAGGGVVNAGTAYMHGCRIMRNAAGHGGGFVNSGTMYVNESTFSENRSTSSNGGGGACENQGMLYIDNSTISNNQSTEIGGGVNNFKGSIYLANCSVTGNVAYGEFSGGGIGNNSGTVHAVNTLFAYNYHRSGGDVTSPTAYTLDDIVAYGGQNGVYLHYCLYQASLPTGTNNVVGNTQYAGLADGSDNSIFSGGSLSKITDGTGTEIGTAQLFRPFIFIKSGRLTTPLKNNSNKGTPTRFSSFNFTNPAIAYYNQTTATWVNLLGNSIKELLITIDQLGALRASIPVVGAIETVTTDALYMFKIKSNPGGTVSGGTIYGDVYKSGTSITVTATPKTGYQLSRWDYVDGLGRTSTASTSNPYTFTVSQNITLVPVFAVTAVTGEWSSPASWTSNVVPTIKEDVLIPTGVTMTISSANANCERLTINPGGKLTLNTGKTLTANLINIDSDAENGNATFVDNGTTIFTADSRVSQTLSSGRNWYLSSPVAGAQFYNLGIGVKSYKESTAGWVNEYQELKPMKGYVSETTRESFFGTLNTGSQSIDLTRTAGITKEGFNLVGNPYPSYLSWDMATKTNVDPTMWYCTKNATNTAYVFDTYNGTSHVGTDLNGTVVTTLIPPMQGFWVRVSEGKSTGTLAFNNSMRSHNMGSTNLLKAPAAILSTQQLVRLLVSNPVNTDEAIILFNPNALDSYDAYDSQKMSNENVAIPEIYTLAGNQHLVINGLSSLIATREIPLVFTTGESNTFSIKASQVSNFDSDTKIILRDNLLNVQQDITGGEPYNFVSEATSAATRFTVIFKTNSVVSDLNTMDYDDNAIRVFRNLNGQITVSCSSKIAGVGIVTVYNAFGLKLESQVMTSTSTVINKSFNPGVYFVSINTNGKITTRKLIIN